MKIEDEMHKIRVPPEGIWFELEIDRAGCCQKDSESED